MKQRQGLKVFRNRVLRIKNWTEQKDATGYLRKLHNEELRNLQSLSIIIRTITPSDIRSNITLKGTKEIYL
jgi:hypothetical protein